MNDEFGDYQTPITLANLVCKVLSRHGLAPSSIVEPTCGVGNFLLAANDQFPLASAGLGVEINGGYLETLKSSLIGRHYSTRVRLIEDDFFKTDWTKLLRDLHEPILVIGNPPWVTNSHVGVLGGTNLPTKTNFQNHSGMDAMTGKSNFDISEWMLIRLLESLRGRKANLAMLCKTAVARKVLMHAWNCDMSIIDAEIRPIDAAAFFGAAVDACLLVCSMAPSGRNKGCRVYRDLEDEVPTSVIGSRDGMLVADVAAYDQWKHLGGEEIYRWRSGVKHDCSKVMELRKEGRLYRNGLGELVDLEDDFIYPMLKSSELANGHTKKPTRWMLVTQRFVGDDTGVIRAQAPMTWKYLLEHGDALDRRASSIYKKRHRFSVFGVGDYAFSPWKVAISGFYKKLAFAVVGSVEGKPIVLDDTGYFAACSTEEEAVLIASLLNSEAARGFFSSYVFWDAKRPITVDLLRRLDLSAVAHEIGKADEFRRLSPDAFSGQLGLFDEGPDQARTVRRKPGRNHPGRQSLPGGA